MYLLALETSSAQGSIALHRDEDLVEECRFDEGLVHGREVIPRIRAMLRSHDLDVTDIEAIGVSIGPGSYTGVRVGVTAAKTLAYALGAAVVPVSSLEVIAASAADSVADGTTLVVVVDGKQRHLYVAVFEVAGGEVARLADDHLVDLRDPRALAERISAGATLVGDGVDLLLDALPDAAASRVSRADRVSDVPRAAVLGRIASRAHRSGGGLRDRVSVHALAPVYLRASEAERRRGLRVSLRDSGTGGGRVVSADRPERETADDA